jgi:hypothetical protein
MYERVGGGSGNNMDMAMTMATVVVNKKLHVERWLWREEAAKIIWRE